MRSIKKSTWIVLAVIAAAAASVPMLGRADGWGDSISAGLQDAFDCPEINPEIADQNDRTYHEFQEIQVQHGGKSGGAGVAN